MVRVYLDEDVSILLGTLLASRNINVLTARDAGMLGASDTEQFFFAIQEKRCLVSHNRVDFEKLYILYTEQSLPHSGMILLSRKRDVYATSHRMIKFFAVHPSIENQLWYL